MISLLLEGWHYDDFHIADVMMQKCDDDQILKANISKVKAIPAQSILFNIDQKADTGNPKESDAILSVFVKVFNEACIITANMLISPSLKEIWIGKDY